MRPVNFDDIDDEALPELPSGTQRDTLLIDADGTQRDTPLIDTGGTQKDVPLTGGTPSDTPSAVTAFLPRGERDWTADYLDGRGGCYESTCSTCGLQFFGWKGRVECRLCRESRVIDAEPADLSGTGLDDVAASAPEAGEAPPVRSIYDAERALASPSAHLGMAVQTVLENYGRLTPGQVEALHGILVELGADNDEAGLGGVYGPQFDMTAFIQGMIRTTKSIEQRLYRPGPDGMQASFTAQELGAITNANKNLLSLVARHHDKVMGWERQRAVEAAHLAAARELPADLQDKYMATLQAELEARGL